MNTTRPTWATTPTAGAATRGASVCPCGQDLDATRGNHCPGAGPPCSTRPRSPSPPDRRQPGSRATYAAAMTHLRAAVCVPTFGDFDARTLGGRGGRGRAGTASSAGTTSVDPLGRGVADTTVALTAIALATSRIRFGPLVTPLARRRPEGGRELASLDRLSGGRLTLGVGNGDDIDFTPVGDPAGPAPRRGARRVAGPAAAAPRGGGSGQPRGRDVPRHRRATPRRHRAAADPDLGGRLVAAPTAAEAGRALRGRRAVVAGVRAPLARGVRRLPGRDPRGPARGRPRRRAVRRPGLGADRRPGRRAGAGLPRGRRHLVGRGVRPAARHPGRRTPTDRRRAAAHA